MPYHCSTCGKKHRTNEICPLPIKSKIINADEIDSIRICGYDLTEIVKIINYAKQYGYETKGTK